MKTKPEPPKQFGKNSGRLTTRTRRSTYMENRKAGMVSTGERTP